jgi:putative photosynthetic complex assembly protein
VSHNHAQTVPTGVLIGAGAMLVFSLIAAGVSSPTETERDGVLVDAPVISVQLQFEDADDGAIEVKRAEGGQSVARLAPQRHNFIRGVMRGMFRTRKLERIDRAHPFVLSELESGRLSLHDPQTDRRVDLSSFGSTNTAAFAALLKAALVHEVPS